MGYAKTGFIRHFCTPNALLTFKEYLLDYALPATKELGEQVLIQHLEQIQDQDVQEKTKESLSKLEQGVRDLYY